MPAPRFIRNVSGVFTEIIAAVSSAADSLVATDSTGHLDATVMPGGSPINTSGGVGDAGKLPKLDSTGRIDVTMMPVGTDIEAQSILASEAISGSNLVNVWNNAGVINVRKADATVAGKEANGFALASISNGTSGTVYFEGIVSGLTGMTPAATQFLATTAGQRTETAPSASGNVVQIVGKALSATQMSFRFTPPITVA